MSSTGGEQAVIARSINTKIWAHSQCAYLQVFISAVPPSDASPSWLTKLTNLLQYNIRYDYVYEQRGEYDIYIIIVVIVRQMTPRRVSKSLFCTETT